MTPEDIEKQRLEVRMEQEFQEIEKILRGFERKTLEELTEENRAFIVARRGYLNEGQKIKFASILKIKEETKPAIADGKNATH